MEKFVQEWGLVFEFGFIGASDYILNILIYVKRMTMRNVPALNRMSSLREREYTICYTTVETISVISRGCNETVQLEEMVVLHLRVRRRLIG